MIDNVILLPAAIADILEARNWYETKRGGLGDDFRLCVERQIEAIQRHPELYPFAFGPYRRALVKRFPYGIFYEQTTDAIVVYSVFHCSRNPETWQSRLPMK
jgi:plasmid stabilization system protein ParE